MKNEEKAPAALPERLLTIRDFAKLAGVPSSEVVNLIRAKKIKIVRTSDGFLYVPLSEITKVTQ